LSNPLCCRWPPSFLVADSTSGSSIVSDYTRSFDRDLTSFVYNNKDIISGKTSYYDYISNRNLSFLASGALSSDNRTMVFTISFSSGATINTIKDIVTKLQKLASKQSYPGIAIGCTGLDALFNDLSTGAAVAFELIDAVVLPIALFILGCNLRSYRHVLVAIVSLGCTLLLALAILVPIANTVTINPFAPSILLTLGIAVCFDYSLFMLSRYREEIIVNMKSKDEAVFSCLLASGHVVILSGFTLFVTFALLVAFPQNFLTSVGIGCGTIICTAVLANMMITPALLLTFDCLMKFDACPSIPFCCKRLCHKSAPTTDEANEIDIDLSKSDVESDRNNDTLVTGSACQTPGEPATPRLSTSNGDLVIEDSPSVTKKHPALRSPRLFWFHIAYFGAKRPYLTMLIAFAVTVPFAIQWSNLVSRAQIVLQCTKSVSDCLTSLTSVTSYLYQKATSDNNIVFLRGSSSLKFLHILADAFPIGAIDPYQVGVTICVYLLCSSQSHVNRVMQDDRLRVPGVNLVSNSLCRWL
jgi:MMPL family